MLGIGASILFFGETICEGNFLENILGKYRILFNFSDRSENKLKKVLTGKKTSERITSQ
jgi:hypothetical protein